MLGADQQNKSGKFSRLGDHDIFCDGVGHTSDHDRDTPYRETRPTCLDHPYGQAESRHVSTAFPTSVMSTERDGDE